MRILCFLLFGLMLTGVTQSAAAQTAPLNEKQKAVALFDVRLDRLQESELAKMLNIKEQLAQNTGDVDMSKAVRLFGMASAPESIDQFQEMEGVEELPINFVVRVQFADEETLNSTLNKLAADGESFSKGGKTYYRPKSGDAPKNVCAGQLDSTTMVMGTDTFVFLDDQKMAFTEGLQSAWSNVSQNEDAIRLVVDLAGARELINEAVEMGKQQADPMSQAFLELVPGMNDLRITVDFSGGDLFSLASTCVDSEAATQLKEALDSILGIAKMAGGAQLNEMKKQPGMADVAGVGEKILRSLSPKLDGNSVSVNIPKPEGFEAAVEKAGAMFGGMMLGGGQGLEDRDDDDF